MNKNFDYELCAGRLRALADPDRLRIVECLFNGAINVSELSDRLMEDIVKISHHLGVLRQAEVVQSEKQGRYVIYSLHPDVMRSKKPCGECVTTNCDERFINLGCCTVELACTQLS